VTPCNAAERRTQMAALTLLKGKLLLWPPSSCALTWAMMHLCLLVGRLLLQLVYSKGVVGACCTHGSGRHKGAQKSTYHMHVQPTPVPPLSLHLKELDIGYTTALSKCTCIHYVGFCLLSCLLSYIVKTFKTMPTDYELQRLGSTSRQGAILAI
jgi:hypothetical protein